MQPGDVMALLITVLLPTLFLLYLARRYFTLKEKRLDVEMALAAEKAAQDATSNTQLEQRVRVLEKLATDGGLQTAAQIEALRDLDRNPAQLQGSDKATN
jgi:hypothetical protein